MGNKLPTISYEASDEETQSKIRVALILKCRSAFEEDNYYWSFPSGKYILRIDDKLCLNGINYQLSDINIPDIKLFFSICINDIINTYNKRNDIMKYLIVESQTWWTQPYFNTSFRYLELEICVVKVVPHYPLTPFVAKLVAKEALSSVSGECPIIYEPYSTLETLHVGRCGHVFSEAVADQLQCPLCRIYTSWTTVRRSDIIP